MHAVCFVRRVFVPHVTEGKVREVGDSDTAVEQFHGHGLLKTDRHIRTSAKSIGVVS